MTRHSTDTCAGCSRFDIRTAVANNGRAMCSGYEREVEWTDHSVLHTPARDREHRKQYVIQLMQQQEAGK